MKLGHVAAAAVSIAAAALFAAPTARAQNNPLAQPERFIDPGEINPIPETPPYPPDIPRADSPVWKPRTGYGVALTAGGGIGNYTAGNIRDLTGLQGTWNVRAAYGTRTYVGVEGAYLGAAGSIAGLGLSGNNLLVRNGFEAMLRLNAPLMVKRMLLEPYLFGGFGWDHYTVTNVTPTSLVDGSDDTVTTPFGVGFDATYLGIVGDLRFAYRPTFEETITNMPANDDLTNWTISAQVGYEF